jgi:hypothetical protein
MRRVLSGRQIGRGVSSMLERYSLSELQAEAKKLGIHHSHKTKPQLIELINAKRQHEEKEEKE